MVEMKGLKILASSIKKNFFPLMWVGQSTIDNLPLTSLTFAGRGRSLPIKLKSVWCLTVNVLASIIKIRVFAKKYQEKTR